MVIKSGTQKTRKIHLSVLCNEFRPGNRKKAVMAKKTRFKFLAACALMAAALLLSRTACAEIEHIEKEELSARLCSPQIVLLDVRTGEVWEKSKIKIKCSRRVDPYNVESWVDSISKDKQIILYCCS
jgi:hypothetical protein